MCLWDGQDQKTQRRLAQLVSIRVINGEGAYEPAAFVQPKRP